MKIQESSNYYQGALGNPKSSGSSSSYNFLFDKNLSEAGNESRNKEGQQSNRGVIAASTKINSYLMPSAIKVNEAKATDAGSVENNEEDIIKEITEKMKKINNMLSKYGITGEVVAARMETIPQNYSMYYVQTEGKDAKNIVIMELENGEVVFGETSVDPERFSYLFDIFRDENGFNKAKFSVEELKDLFMKFIESHDKL